MNKKGFTLIELLAVIIILGILMLIAIPSVTAYINNSRKNAYVTTIQEIAKGTVAKVNSGELEINDPDVTYYVPCSCVDLESGDVTSPYGKINPGYVVVTYDGDNYNYYYTGKDEKDMGVAKITKTDTITKDTIVSDVGNIDTSVGVAGTHYVIVYNNDCSNKSAKENTSSVTSGEEYNGKICKRATTLHTEECTAPEDGQFKCKAAGYTSGNKGTTITYGNLGTKGNTPAVGDAFDCDVNADGTFDSTTERFYYVTNDDDKSVLIYYNDVYGGVPSKTGVMYDSENKTQYGPRTGYNELPSILQWKNSQLIHPGTRQLINENDTLYNDTDGNEGGPNPLSTFTYTDKAARFLTYQEMKKATGLEYWYVEEIGCLDNYIFFMENVDIFSKGTGLYGYWLETPRGVNTNLPEDINGFGRGVNYNYANVTDMGIRPAITVLTSNIDYYNR